MIYRLKQFWWAWTARPLSQAQLKRVVAVLVSAEFITLYHTQSYNDQQHTLRILDLLDQQNEQNNALCQAALLHDVGKTRLSLSILDRVLIVLASRLIPRRAAGWGDDPNPPYRHRKAFVVKQWHAAWGAEMVAQLGGDTLTINLIRRHQDTLIGDGEVEEDRLLRQLQWADDQS